MTHGEYEEGATIPLLRSPERQTTKKSKSTRKKRRTEESRRAHTYWERTNKNASRKKATTTACTERQERVRLRIRTRFEAEDEFVEEVEVQVVEGSMHPVEDVEGAFSLQAPLDTQRTTTQVRGR